MGVNTIENKQNFASADAATERRPSPNIWADCPVNDIMENPGLGHHFYDDFSRIPLLVAPTLTTQAVYGNTYKAFGSSGATIVSAAELTGGGLTLTETDDNEGINLQLIALPYKLINTGGKFWFECRFKCATVTTLEGNILVGLMDSQTLTAIVPITAAGALADVNFVGFQRLEATGTQMNTTYKTDGNAQVIVKTSALPSVMVADTYLKVGMKFDPADRKLRFYVNNIQLADTYTVTSTAGNPFPNDVNMSPVFAMLCGTSNDLITTLSWWRSAQINVAT